MDIEALLRGLAVEFATVEAVPALCRELTRRERDGTDAVSPRALT
jgi:hypothetical protein